MARRELKLPGRARQKRRAALLRESFFFLALCGAIVAAVVFFLREPSLRIRDIEVSGAQALSSGEIAAAVRESLDGNYLGLIPKENILFYPRRGVEKSLLSRFTRLSSADVSSESFHSISISVVERKASYLWCGAVREAVTTECFFIDATGYLFGRAATFSDNALMRFYGSLTGDSDETIGRRFLPENEFEILRSFLGAAAELGFPASSLVKKEGTDYELNLKEGGRLIFSLGEGAEKAVSNLESALDTNPLKENIATKRSSLDYLDLRFGNKVFFKFR